MIIFIYAVLAIFAPIFAPYGEAEVFPEPYAPWSPEHIFGTDQMAVIYFHMIFGARNTVGIAVATTFFSHWGCSGTGYAQLIDPTSINF